MTTLTKLLEPQLAFRYGQAIADPRDGLTLFGPLDEVRGISYGIVGTRPSIERFHRWLTRLQQPIINDYTGITRPYYPGFTAAFHTTWQPAPAIAVVIEEHELLRRVHIDDKHQRTHQTVNLFADAIRKAQHEEETMPLLWFVLITDEVYKYCRPKSIVPSLERITAPDTLPPKFAKRFTDDTPSLFPQITQASIPYQYDADFHHQLKAQLLMTGVPTQIIRESTIAHHDFTTSMGNPKRHLDPVVSDIAWHLSTGSSTRPGAAPGRSRASAPASAISASSLRRTTATQIRAQHAAPRTCSSTVATVWSSAAHSAPGTAPRSAPFTSRRARRRFRDRDHELRGEAWQPAEELFIHGKIVFDDAEWEGFTSATPPGTNLVGIRIKKATPSSSTRAAITRSCGAPPTTRMTAPRTSGRKGSSTSPNVSRTGRAEPSTASTSSAVRQTFTTVLNDVMALTKVNYNSCIFADGIPVTLRFADAIGEILTAGPATEMIPPLPFKMYI